jgi:alpha-beta hydrolase superfamily lysophospholipase
MNIVLVRGLVREKYHWGSFVTELKDSFPSANIITPEIPGVGEFVDQVSPNNLEDMVTFMRANIKDQLTGEDNYLVAMSLGGMMARQWIEIYPTDFKQVTLVNTSFKGINPLFNRLKPMSVVNFIKIFLTPGVEARENAIVKMVSNNTTNHEKIIKDWIEIQKRRPVKRQSFINQIKGALSFKPQQSWPDNLPLLILGGKKDRLCNYKSSLELNAKWGGSVYIHPEAGHDLPIDASTWMIEKLKEVIKE